RRAECEGTKLCALEFVVAFERNLVFAVPIEQRLQIAAEPDTPRRAAGQPMRALVVRLSIEADVLSSCVSSFKRYLRLDRVLVRPFIRTFWFAHPHGEFIGDEAG